MTTTRYDAPVTPERSTTARSTDAGIDVRDRAQIPTGCRVAVLVPCYNEAVTIQTVVRDFHAHLPEASVFVYDNNSSDGTATLAAEAGATVRHVPLQGKGNVVRRMFADIEADVYLLVDGDGTYDAAVSPQLVDLVVNGGHDLVNGERVSLHADSYPRGHAFGNKLIAGMVTNMFRRPAGDMLSGFKALSRRFVKSFPVSASGFEIETELTVHALGLAMPTSQLPVPYSERPEGSESKLSTFSDGLSIVRMIGGLLRSERPLAFFTAIAGILALVAVGLGVPLVVTYVHTHTVPRFPTAILATGLVILACLNVTAGLILDTVTRGRREVKMLRYLAISGPRANEVASTGRAASHVASAAPTGHTAGPDRSPGAGVMQS